VEGVVVPPEPVVGAVVVGEEDATVVEDVVVEGGVVPLEVDSALTENVMAAVLSAGRETIVQVSVVQPDWVGSVGSVVPGTTVGSPTDAGSVLPVT
jgi:hypothetical protein